MTGADPIPGAWPETPAELLDGGAADPDRAWRWRDAEDGGEDLEIGADPDDGPIDSDESFAAWKRAFPTPCPLLPSVEAQERLAREG